MLAGRGLAAAEVSGGWDLANAYPISVLMSFSVAAQDATPTALFFKPDGTVMYVIGTSSDTVYQYTLSTAWDVSTASYASKSFSVTSQDTAPQGLFFKSDGTIMYVVGSTNDSVYQYTLSTAWDISTASYASKSFSVAGQESIPTDVFFKPDGTKMYILGGANSSASRRVWQYSLSTAWDVNTSSYDSVFFSVSSQESICQGMYFSSDGTAMYVVGTSYDTVYQYTLSTAWDISTASYASKSFSVTAQESVPNGLSFESDGTAMYVVGSGTDTVYKYTLNTTWDVSTALYDTKTFYTASQEIVPHDVAFKSDGTVMYVVGNNTDRVYQYTLSTAWDVSTASYTSKSFLFSAQDGNPLGVFFKPDGTVMYMIGGSNDTVFQYTLSTAWDVSTASYASKSFSIAGQETSPSGVFFKPDGTAMYIIGTLSDRVHEYTLSTAWDVSTASYTSKFFSVNAQATAPQGLFFKPDGTVMYVVDSVTDAVYQYNLSTAWDISTTSYSGISYSVVTFATTANGISFESNGNVMYIVDSDADAVFQFSTQ